MKLVSILFYSIKLNRYFLYNDKIYFAWGTFINICFAGIYKSVINLTHKII